MIMQLISILIGTYKDGGVKTEKIIREIERESKKTTAKGKKLIKTIEKTQSYYILKAMGAIQNG